MPIDSMAIIGSTSLGSRLVYFSLLAGYRTIFEDISVAALEQGIARVRSMLYTGAAQTGDAAQAEQRPIAFLGLAETLVLANSVEDAVRDADLILEAVPDEMEMKLELFTIFDKFAKPGAIFASTTGALAISDLAEMTVCPERCIGMRLVPAAGRQELHLRAGRSTSRETLEACREVGRRMGLSVILESTEQPRSAAGS